MSLLTWSEELQVQHPRMDATHREFVEHVATLEATLHAAPTPADSKTVDPAVLAAYDALLAHTVEHFAQEDRWMVATGFTPDNCHSNQHSQVLAVLRDVRRQATEDGKPELLGQLLPELVQWFTQHAQAADHGLAAHLNEIGFDVATGHLANPPAETISGCGSERCST